MRTLSKEFHFSAAHRLEGLQEGHPCGRMHGHNYIIRVFLIGEVNFVKNTPGWRLSMQQHKIWDVR